MTGHDLAGPCPLGPHFLDDTGIITIGHEADILAIRLGRIAQARITGPIRSIIDSYQCTLVKIFIVLCYKPLPGNRVKGVTFCGHFEK